MNRIIAPSTDFRAVRDGRNSQVFYVDVALDTARVASLGTALVLPISGNSFYIDANPTDGNAFVHFQDTNFDRGPVPLYVSPGTIFNIPYTQILLENTAQPGKKIRIAYGIDVDFQPGSVSQIAVTNTGGYTSVRQEAYTPGFVPVALAVGAVQLLSPAANVNGFQIYDLQAGGVATVQGNGAFLAKVSAPANIADGDGLGVVSVQSYNVNNYIGGKVGPMLVPAGKGIYFYGAAGSVYTAGYCYATLVGKSL